MRRERQVKASKSTELEQHRRLERYAVGALRKLGDRLGARSLTLDLEDIERREVNFHADLSRDPRYGSWHFETGSRDDAAPPPITRRNRLPQYVLRSRFCYPLDLPHRWSGMITVDYPGITILSARKYHMIQEMLRDVSQNVTIMLLGLELERKDTLLVEEREQNERLSSLAAELSKELYGLNSISNVLAHSSNVQHVLTKVLETALQVMPARLGAMAFPESRQCAVLRSRGSRLERLEDGWFQYYFAGRFRKHNAVKSDGVFEISSVQHHPDFPVALRTYLASQDIDSVLEFTVRYRNEVVGLGLLGLESTHHNPPSSRLLKVLLNMVGLFIEHISLVDRLQVRLQETDEQREEIQRKHNFLLDQVDPYDRTAVDERSSTRRLLEKIEQTRSSALLAELASGVAHQIRNPLNNLVYALHILREEGISEDERKELYDRITERVETMNKMINEFIQYARMPAPRLMHESINEVLTNTLKSFEGWLELAETRVEKVLDPGLPLTRLDLFLMSQAFNNVVKNALEAMDDGGSLRVQTRKLRIRHGPEPRLEFAEIVFEDSGPGIDPGDVGKVVRPFYSRKEGGLGLGLPLVHHIVRAHGGAFQVGNRPEGGARVRIYLPIR